jgi:hypothetical protein
MQRTAAKIYREQSLLAIQTEIASVKEIFRLQDVAELIVAEQRYLLASSASSDTQRE